MKQISEIYRKGKKHYQLPKIQPILMPQDEVVGPKRVQRLMEKADVYPIKMETSFIF
ncbi:IS3 family transposase [Ectobacillus ponti]|uniref:IS3 family transposase n=1 Tax=Ectobacillus ponti TaxID=2961894 RepID=UPI0034D23D28